MEHTPGPWTVGMVVQNDGSLAIMAEIDGESERVARVDNPEADGSLIAAAPELLEALERIEEICNTETSALHPLRDIARAALKAAKGDA